MTSDYTADQEHVDAHSLPIRDCSARLSLKPSSSSARSAVDGAWWPRSTDPVTELAALIEALGAQRAPVRGLTLNRAGWDSAPRRIRLASGRKVAVDWFQTGDVRMIGIVDTDYQRIDLFVIPVETAPAIAELALTMATDGHDPDIAAHGGRRSAPVCRAAEAEASPANEEGASDHSAQDRALGNPPSGAVDRRRVVLLPDGPAEQIDLPHSRSEGPLA